MCDFNFENIIAAKNISSSKSEYSESVISFRQHVTPIGRGWRIGEGLPYMDGRREIKYLPWTNMHAAYVLIVRGCKQRPVFNHCLVVMHALTVLIVSGCKQRLSFK